jgi:hypothetical protein
MPSGLSLPAQGWKLHLSATIASAPDLLSRALPCLRRSGTGFKIARSLADLSHLNEGRSGLSQVGKFMTVYPPDDAAAVSLALELDELTRGIAGPPVPSDLRLCDGSAVYYRYGGFSGLSLRLPHGETVPAILDPDGNREPDRRSEVYSQPAWVADPFADAVIRTGRTRTPPPLVVAGRYVLTAAVSHSPRGRIFLALDLEGQARAILKEAHEGSAATADGRDATDMLRAEAHALGSIGEKPYLPRFLGLAREGQSLFLAMEDTGGRTLGSIAAEMRARGTPIAWPQLEAWAREIADMLRDLHVQGWLHRDLKPTNVMQRPDGRLAIIDLELAVPLSAGGPGDGRGTPGYMSAAQKAGHPPTLADDLHGFGALFYFLATAGDPGQTPRADPLRDRPLMALRPDAPDWFADIVETCLGSGAHTPFRGMDEVVRALAAQGSWAVSRAAPPPAGTEDLAPLLAKTVSGLLQAGGEPGEPLDINTGLAGRVLALADLADPEQDTAMERLRDLAQLLAREAEDPSPDPLPGLYVGDSGIAVSLLRTAQVLRSDGLRARAAALMDRSNRLAHGSPDMFNGMAGRLLANLLFFEETGGEGFLAAAQEFAGRLAATAVSGRAGECGWAIPEGYRGLSGKLHTGYSHGAAGIADALLDLHEVTGEESHAALALGAARWLLRLAEPCGLEGEGLEWPVTEGGQPMGPLWCHGAGGVARLFLSLDRLRLMDGALDVARRAMVSVTGPGRALGPTRCHGLAGSIEILLDVEAAAGDGIHLARARELGQLLPAFALPIGNTLEWCGDEPGQLASGYMTGGAGIAVALQRLFAPERPHQLSRRGFRWNAPRAAPDPVHHEAEGGRP